jgi:glucose 1-dehydrogenase
MKRLEGQTALVTGANSGIGAEIARDMAEAGANVGINYVVGEEHAKHLVEDIVSSGGRALAVKADVSQEDEVARMFETVISTYGTVDILVSNAGVQKDASFTSMSLDQWQSVLDVNLTGAFLCARAAAQEFLRRGVVAERSAAAGKIIFTSSVHEVIPWAHHANYAASKIWTYVPAVG